MTIPRRLRAVAEDIAAGRRRWAKVKTLLSWFGRKGRGTIVVQTIREALKEAGLRTDPDFTVGSVHNYLEFKSDAEGDVGSDENKIGSDESCDGTGSQEKNQREPDEKSHGGTQSASHALGPALCIGMLPAANRPDEVVTITRDSRVDEAITLMMMHDYSQLPVTQDRRRIDGMISWRSIGRTRTGGHVSEYVRDCLEDIRIIDQDAPLLETVNRITDNEVVLVRGRDRRISGIVTTSDLSREYHRRAEPFLLLQEVEDRIRMLINKKLLDEEIRGARHPGDDKRDVEDASDLGFGEYVRLLESDENWKRLGLRIDRKVFVKLLDEVREVRNDVMHFSPDSSEPENLDKVRMLRSLLEQLGD